MEYKVEALDTYEKNNIKDSELKIIPKEGKKFKVSKERLSVLLGNNPYNLTFVKVIEPKDKIDNQENVESNE